jgi:hypothetical protein
MKVKNVDIHKGAIIAFKFIAHSRIFRIDFIDPAQPTAPVLLS